MGLTRGGAVRLVCFELNNRMPARENLTCPRGADPNMLPSRFEKLSITDKFSSPLLPQADVAISKHKDDGTRSIRFLGFRCKSDRLRTGMAL